MKAWNRLHRAMEACSQQGEARGRMHVAGYSQGDIRHLLSLPASRAGSRAGLLPVQVRSCEELIGCYVIMKHGDVLSVRPPTRQTMR